MFLFNLISLTVTFSPISNLNTSYVSIQSGQRILVIQWLKFKYILCFYSITGATGDALDALTFKYILCFYSMAAERYLYATWRPFKYILCFYSIERGVPVHNAPLNLNTSYVSIQLSPLRTAEYPVLFKYILCFYSILLVLLLPSAYPI